MRAGGLAPHRRRTSSRPAAYLGWIPGNTRHLRGDIDGVLMEEFFVVVTGG
jgi:hypothetical protein